MLQCQDHVEERRLTQNLKVKLELNALLRNNSRSKNHQVILDFLDKHIYMIASNPEVTFWTTLHTSWWRYCTILLFANRQ